MQLIRGLTFLNHQKHPCVATIGKFDGIHLGHQQIFKHLTNYAKENSMASMVIVFEPDPQAFFLGQHAPARLTCFREKWIQLLKCQIDIVVCIHFNEQVATMAPHRFIQDVLQEQLNIRHLIVGNDFKFGANRAGDFQLLTDLQSHQFTCEEAKSIEVSGERVSSSLIRHYLSDGDFNKTTQLLGRRYSMSGRVLHGDKIGRTLGFPTLNIAIKRKKPPLQGVYLVAVKGIGHQPVLWGVANLGIRPTLSGEQLRFEVHLLAVNVDAYGQYVDVYFFQKIRDEKRFASKEALVQQIVNDVSEAEDLIHHYSNELDGKFI